MPIHSNTPLEQGGASRVRELWHAVLHNRWLVLAVFSVAVGLGALSIWLAQPVYQSQATVQIDDQSASQRLVLSEISPLGGAGQGKLPTEMVVLRSRRIAEGVVDSLGLQVQLVAPRIARSAVLERIQVTRNAHPGLYILTQGEHRRYTVRWEGIGPRPPLPESVNPASEIQIDGLAFTLVPEVRENLPDELRIQVSSRRDAVEGVRKDLAVQRLDPLADVISVQYQSNDPVLAAAVPNAAATGFMRYKREASRSETNSSVGFLREQVAAYETQVSASEARLKNFREEAQVVSLPDEASEQVRRLAALQAKRDEMEAERQSLASLLAQVRDQQGGTSYRQLASFPVFLSNVAIQNILQSLTTLENERAELMVRRTTENVDVQGINRRVDELESQLYRTAQSYLGSVDNQIASANTTLARFGEQLAAIPAREIEFARLRRQQELLEQIYTMLQTRLKEQEIQQAVDPGDIRVLDSALLPQRPISPRPFRTMVLSSMIGLLLGLAAAFGREALDTKVRTRADVIEAAGGEPVIGVIPRIDVSRIAHANGNGSGNGGNRKGRQHARVRKLAPQDLLQERLVAQLAPRNPAAEAYRALRTNIAFARPDEPPAVLVVTSAMPGDGKSTTSANLAITLAKQGARTILVDGDLRLGLLHRIFGLPQEPGLTHLLLHRSTLDEAIREIRLADGEVPLHFLSAGVFPPNPAEMLGGPRMREFLDELRSRYDTIIFDAPPVNLVTDAAVLGKLADATLIVVRSGATDRRSVEHAAAQLRQLNVPIGGLVLNDVKVTGDNRYYGTYGYGA